MKNIICYIVYGENQEYYNSAKFSILNLLNYTSGNKSIEVVVLSEKIKEFKGYPVTSIKMTNRQIDDWSLNGKYHFRIKNLGLQYIIKTLNLSINDSILFFDTDVYFKKNPLILLNLITNSRVVMYKDEGKIYKKERFSYYKDNLKDNSIQNKGLDSYILDSNSRMWGSAIIGIPALAYNSLKEADILMLNLIKKLDISRVHTIEQFSLSEILKKMFKIIEGKKYIRIYSTSKRKNYALKKINTFFKENNSVDIKQLSKKSLQVNLSRPIHQVIKDKFFS